MAIFRGEIYFVCLGPTVGREINTKRRPVVVLSINDLNRKPLVVTVVPGSTWSGKRIFPTEAKIEPTETNWLSNPTLFLCHQLKAIDHSRFDHDPVGVVTSQDLEKIETAVKLCLGLVS
jgi:mRNA interferase MazF